MRHKYHTRGIVLARAPFGERHVRLTIATEELGVVLARAAGVRAAGSKLAHALVTLAESDVVLVAGAEGWRVAGALLAENWFVRLAPHARERAGRTVGLLVRLAPGEVREPGLFTVLRAYLAALARAESDLAEGAELVAAESLLAACGVGEAAVVPDFAPEALTEALAERPARIARINRGIAASGL